VPNVRRVLFLLAHGKGQVCRVPEFVHTANVLAHGKREKYVCRVPNVRRVLFLLAHGKGQVCRVPEFAHTANVLAHGNGVFL